MTNAIAWYSPATGLLISDGEYVVRKVTSGQFPADLTALTWKSEAERFQQLFAASQQQLQDSICALESAKEELKQLAFDLGFTRGEV